MKTETLLVHMKEAEVKAWQSLARYKFQMFGYWAAIWVHLNRIGGFKQANPFGEVIRVARADVWRRERAKNVTVSSEGGS